MKRKGYQRIISLFLILLLFTGSLQGAFAAEPGGQQPTAGSLSLNLESGWVNAGIKSGNLLGNDEKTGAIQVSSEAQLRAAVFNREQDRVVVQLTRDISLANALVLEDDMELVIYSDSAKVIRQTAPSSQSTLTRHFEIKADVTLKLQNIELLGQSYGTGGVHAYAGSTLHLEGYGDSKITGVGSFGYGGGMRLQNAKEVNISGITISDNATTVQGGGLLIENVPAVTLDHVEITGNSSLNGAGIFITGETSNLTIKNSIINENKITGTGSGGGIHTFSSKVDIYNSILSDNKVVSTGAAIFARVKAKVTINESLLTGNEGMNGVAIYFTGEQLTDRVQLEINDSKISENKSNLSGGGFYLLNAHTAINGSILEGNTALLNGGAGYVWYSNLSISGSLIKDNQADYPEYPSLTTYGGGIYLDQVANVTLESGTEFIGNYASAGGAIGVSGRAHWDRISAPNGANIIFSGNTAEDYATSILDDDIVRHGRKFEGTAISMLSEYTKDKQFVYAYNNYDIAYPELSKEVFHVTYVTHNSTTEIVDHERYIKGSQVFLLEGEDAVPTRDSYQFRGWAMSSTATVPYDFADNGEGKVITDAITGNITLYALWEPRYEIRFDLNGGKSGDGDFSTILLDTGVEKVVLPDDDPYQLGYKFVGWYDEPQSYEERSDIDYREYEDAHPGTPYTTQSDIDASITLYAHWAEAPFEIQDAYNKDYSSEENQLKIALSSLRENIKINVHNNITLTDAMRATQLPDNEINISITGVNGSKQIIQTAAEQHFYAISPGRKIKLDLKNIKMTNGLDEDNNMGYGGITVDNGAELVLRGDNTVFGDMDKSGAGAAGINGGTIKVINNSKATISGIAFERNTVDNYGGAIYIDSSEVEIDDCTFVGNQAKNGGAIAIRETSGTGEVRIKDSDFSGNKADGDGYGHGGAIYLSNQEMYGRLWLDGVTFSGNNAVTGYVTKIAPEYADIHTNNVTNFDDTDFNDFTIGTYAYNNYDVSYLDPFYSVTYHANGADRGNVPEDENRYAKGEQAGLQGFENLQRDHYSITGWLDADGEDVNDSFEVYEDTHLYAKWSLNSYTITFEDLSGSFIYEKSVDALSYISDEIIPDEAAVRAENNTVDDKFLEYWYIPSASNEPYSFEEPITENITLYAKWTDKDQYQVVFHSRGGTQVSSITLMDQDEFNPKSPDYESQRAHYEFQGWSPHPDGSLILNEPKAIEYFAGYMTNEVLDLYAVWQADVYEVAWYQGSQELYARNATIETELYHDEAENSRETPAGKRFDGWYSVPDNDDADENLQVLAPFFVTEATKLHAHYSDIWYTVTIRDTDANGEVLEVFQVKHGEDVKENDIILSKENHDYVGLVAEQGRKLSNITDDLEVYAKFAIHTYTIKFYEDTDENLRPAWETTKDHGDSFYGFPQELTNLQNSLIASPKAQHEFDYWGLLSGLNVETVFNGYPIVKDWDIYAHWNYVPEVSVDVIVSKETVPQTAGAVTLDAGNAITLAANEKISDSAEYPTAPTYQWFMAFADDKEYSAVTDMAEDNKTHEMLYAAVPGVYYYYVVMEHGGVTVRSEPVKINIQIPKLYTVSYDTNEGEGVLPTIPTLYTLYSPIFLPDESLISRSGYNFKAWVTVEGDTVKDTSAGADAFNIVVLDEKLANTADDTNNIKIVAQWEAIYEGGGSSSGSKPRTAELTIKGINESGSQIYLATEQHTVGSKVTVQAPVIPGYTLSDEEQKTITISAVSSNNLLVFEYALTDPEGYLPLETGTHIAYINGYPDGSVGPERNITRAEVATMFYRLVAADRKLGSYENAFTDVPASAWYYDAVSFLSNFKVVQGYANGTFEPEKSITRAEFVTIASRFEDMTNGAHDFNDVAGSWAENYIVNTFTKGWVTGYPDGTFRPEANITRAEAVTIINRILGRNLQTADVPQGTNVYNDLQQRHWAYAQILEASIPHEYEYRDNGTEIWK